MSARRTYAGAALGSALLLSACGSTVPVDDRVAVGARGSGSGGGQSLGLSAEAPSAAEGAVGGLGAGSSAGASGVSSGGGSSSGGRSAAGAAVPGRAGSAAVEGSSSGAASTGGGARPGVAPPVKDTTPVRVGAFYLDGGNAALGAGFAATPVNFGDGRLEAKAVVADINAHGGVGGRPIQLFLQKIAATDTGNPAAFDAACKGLVQDHKVFAIVSIFNLRSPLAACAAKNKVFLIDVALGSGDDDLYRQFGDWAMNPAAMSLDTEQRLVLRTALTQGTIGPKVRVGVVVQNDDDIYPRVFKNAIEPTLRQMGVPHESAGIANATDNTGLQNAILKFKTDGVQVVQFSVGNGGIPPVLFMQAAEQQQFRPTYVLGDSSDTWFVGSSAPRAQVEKITGVGSYPVANVDAAQYATTPREKKCLDVITRAGQPVSDRHTSLTATFYCESLYGFAAAGALVQGPLTPDTWRNAYRSLGAAYPALTTFASDTGKNPSAAAQVYRTLAWDKGCGCVRYTSENKAL